MANVQQIVPLLNITSMDQSLPFYLERLGFELKNQWSPEGQIRWCWLTLGGASLMLQQLRKPAAGKLGAGVSFCFQCEDALAIYRELLGRGVEASEPKVGNGLWVTLVTDPDGYRLEFASPTDTPEDTLLSSLTNKSLETA